MITFRPLTETDFSAFAADYNTTRLSALCRGYGMCPALLDTWALETKNGPAALIGRFAGEMTLCVNDRFSDSEAEETAAFLRFMGHPLQGSASAVSMLGFSSQRKATVYQKPCGVTATSLSPVKEGLSSLYDRLALGTDGDIRLGQKDDWVADVSHRVRHGVASAFVTENGAALVGFLTDRAAVLSGIVIPPDRRGQGEGTRLLSAVAGAVSPRTLFAATETAAPFYEQNGFEAVDTQSFVTQFI